MKCFNKLTLINLLCGAILPGAANAQVVPYSSAALSAEQGTNSNTQNLVNYLKNLGYYLGFDITNPPSPQPANTQLIDFNKVVYGQGYLYNSFFGSIPVPTTPPGSSGNSSGASVASTSDTTSFQFVPQGTPNAQLINNLINFTFANQGYSNPGSTNTVTVSPLIDQPPYQSDPVSQSLLNILGTPDVSYCTNYGTLLVNNPTNPNGGKSSCDALASGSQSQPTLFETQVVGNVIGKIPSSSDFYTYTTNQPIIPQLNVNSLLAPLYYTTTNSNSANPQTTSGLAAQSQAQEAANFIRYVSGSVSPTILPNVNAYNRYYNDAHIADTTNKNPPSVQSAKAQAALSTYIANLRVYAAQSSVGFSNLYYILSKRLPQNTSSSSDSGTKPSSQALNEYNMATWRLANGGDSTTEQWVQKINTASSATVQKEIAILLSEINYQLYLDRQIQERMLLTNSVSLLQATKASQPNSDLTNQNYMAPDNTANIKQ